MHFESRKDDLGYVRVNEDRLADGAARAATAALELGRNARMRHLLVDLSRAQSAEAPSATECFELGKRLAEAGRGLLKAAFVTPEGCIEHHELTFTVAANRGLIAAAFGSEAEALSWLQS